MSFLNPLMLLGIGAAIFPVLFHFIYRQKAKIYPFPAIRFLKKVHKRASFFSKLEGILLLITRCLIIIILSVAFSKPLHSSINRADPKTGKTVVIVDNSYSMTYKKDDRTAFADAVMWAERFIKSPNADEKYLFLWTSDAPGYNDEQLWPDKKDLLKKISKKRISFGKHHLTALIKKAAQVLKQADAGVKRIVVFTDLQRKNWTDSKNIKGEDISALLKNNSIKLFLVDMTGGLDKGNIVIEKIKVKKRAMHGEIGLDINITIKNYFNRTIKDASLSIFLDKKSKGRTFVNLLPNKRSKIHFFVSHKDPVRFNGSVSISASDPIDIDNERFFTSHFPSGIKVLIIDGDPRPFSFDSESFYIFNALNPGTEGVSSFTPLIVTPDKLDSMAIDDFDVYLLLNVPALSRKVIKKITENVENRGKGILISLGNQIKAEDYNRRFGSLLPAKLRGIKEVKKGEYEHIRLKEDRHKILDIFNDSVLKYLSKANFSKYFLLKQDYARHSQTILTFTNGTPYLVLARKKNGRAALLTSSIDREWNNFPIQPAFLPIMHQIVLFLTKNLSASSLDTDVGGEVNIPVLTGSEDIIVIDPAGKERLISHGMEKDTDIVTFDSTEIPGIYTIKYNRKKDIKKDKRYSSIYFAVNTEDTSESDLSKVSDDEISPLCRKENCEIVPFGREKDIAAYIRKSSAPFQFWTPLIYSLIFLFCAETIISAFTRNGKRV